MSTDNTEWDPTCSWFLFAGHNRKAAPSAVDSEPDQRVTRPRSPSDNDQQVCRMPVYIMFDFIDFQCNTHIKMKGPSGTENGLFSLKSSSKNL